MTSKTQNAENAESRPLDDQELELVRGGFTPGIEQWSKSQIKSRS